jgi:hypothetical protein
MQADAWMLLLTYIDIRNLLCLRWLQETAVAFHSRRTL